MKELEAKLEQAIRDRDVQIGAVEQMDQEIVYIEEQLAEAKKPKLVSGNRYHDGCNGIVVMKLGKKWRAYYDTDQKYEGTKKDVLDRIENVGYVLVDNVLSGLNQMTAKEATLKREQAKQ